MAVGSLNPHLMASGGDVASLGYCGFRLTSVATMMIMVVIVMEDEYDYRYKRPLFD